MYLLSCVKTALFVSAHPDDTEFGAAGLAQILIEQGVEVYLLVLSNPVDSLPSGYESDTLIKEQLDASGVYGVAQESIEILDVPVRNFPEYRQQILDTLILKRKQVNPDLIITNSAIDFHQDHNTVANEVIRAFKNKIILGYTHPWNSRATVGNVFFELTKQQVATKVEALQKFSSQSGRIYAQPDVIRSMAVEAGVAAGFEYAERFELVTMSIPK